MSYRQFVLFFAVAACRKEPVPQPIQEKVDAAVPLAAASSVAPAPWRPIPRGLWSSEDRARIQLGVYDTRVKLSEHLETERAPLIAEGPLASTMELDGSFTMKLTVDTLKKELLSRCLDCKSKDVSERLDSAMLDGQAIAKGGTVTLTLTFTESDRVLEMCFAETKKKCTRLVRGG